MGIFGEVRSFLSPPTTVDVASTPAIGDEAPATAELPLDKQLTVLAFLRHCGCPFAEKTFLRMNTTSRKHPDVKFIAISHSDTRATARWLASLRLEGSNTEQPPVQKMTAPPATITDPTTPLPGNLFVIADPDRRLFAQYGLGVSNLSHMLSAGGLVATIKLGREEGIWNRPTESGSRWQAAGGFAIDEENKVTWSWVAGRADDVQDFEHAVASLQE